MFKGYSVIAFFLYLFNAGAFGATINVPGDQGTIQAGIDAAVSGVDEVVVGPGIYNELIDLSGKAITVQSSGGAGVTTIDATGLADPGDGRPVVRCDSGEGADTVLEGFTITGGTGDTGAFGGIPVGGGMFMNNSSPTVRGCRFTGNSTDFGGGMLNNLGSPTVTDCTFLGNTTVMDGAGFYNNGGNATVVNCAFIGGTANSDGGGMSNFNSDLAVTNCVFTGNSAGANGGGMTNDFSSEPTLTNCTFSGNSATNAGGGIFNFDDSSPSMVNCIFWGNTDSGGMDESGQIHTDSGAPVVNYSDVQGGWTGAGGVGNLDADPLFVDADGGDNTAGTGDDDLRLSAGSPCINAGWSAAVTASTDLDGNPRHVCTVDMGAFEDQAGVGALGVHNVTQNTFFATIQGAIDAAVGGDVIEVEPCTYFEMIDLGGKAITLRSTDPMDSAVVGATLIDASPLPDPGDGKPVVRCDNGEGADTVFEGLTMTGGTGHIGRLGGGMYLEDASPTVTKCVFRDNSSGRGGGLANVGLSSPTVTDCTFRGNDAGDGGGMFSDNGGSPLVTHCAFIENTAGVGGATSTLPSSGLTVVNCVFEKNTASSGGAMIQFASSPTVIGCTFIGNVATNGSGGGMDNPSGSSPTVIGCSFIGNQASSGGGMYNGGGTPTIINCAFSGNQALLSLGAFGVGGAMENFAADPTVTNCTFSGNSAEGDGGGMYNVNNSIPAIANCVFWGNSDPGGMDESAQIHVFSGAPVVNYSDVQGGWTGAGGAGNIDADPMFVDADGADDVVGTEDDDVRLVGGSPCIDVGDNSVVTLASDLDGASRVRNCVVDLGAYETAPVPATVIVDTDCDHDVDGVDFAQFAQCFNKAGNPPRTLGCPVWVAHQVDSDDDGDVDGVDFAKFAQCFNKAGNPPRTLGCPEH
jgi:hypothetical protein